MRRQGRWSVVLVAALGMPDVALPQTKTPAPVGPAPLEVTAEVEIDPAPTSSPSSGKLVLAGPIRCDGEGNVFFVPVPLTESGRAIDTSKGLDLVTRVSSDGTKTGFTLSSALDPTQKGASIRRTALDSEGRFYLLTTVGPEPAERDTIVLAPLGN